MHDLQSLFQTIDVEDAISFLQTVIQVKSVNPPGDEKRVAEAIQKRLANSGLNVHLDDLGENRANLIVSLSPRERQGEKVLIYSGHFDTVPTGSVQWEHGPYDGERVQNKIYGRGTTDMKSGVAAMIVAMEYIARSGINLSGTLRFVGTAGEEVDGFGAKEVVKKKQIDDATAMVISEPSTNRAFIAHKGALWLEFTIYGKTAHGSMPDQGINAILAMNTLINELNQYTFSYKPHPMLGHPTINIATIHGGVKTNVVPDKCSLTVDIRTVPGQRHDQIVAEMDRLVKNACDSLGATYEVQVLNDMAAIATSEQDPFIQLSLETVKKYFNQNLVPQGVNYYTDGSVYGPHLGIPILIYGPGEPTMAHQPNEWVEIDKYIDSIRFFIALAIEYLS